MSKPATDLIAEIEAGQFNADLSTAFDKVVEAVMETGRPGAVGIKIVVTPTGRKTVKVDASFAAKEPEHPRNCSARLPEGIPDRAPDIGRDDLGRLARRLRAPHAPCS
jgi:hypothetical protein